MTEEMRYAALTCVGGELQDHLVREILDNNLTTVRKMVVVPGTHVWSRPCWVMRYGREGHVPGVSWKNLKKRLEAKGFSIQYEGDQVKLAYAGATS